VKVPLLDLGAQNVPLKREIMAIIEEVYDSGRFIMGHWVEKFEREIAEYLGVRQAIGVSSGTDALLLSLMALDMGPNDAVVTTTFSFFATAGAVCRVGAVPFFADIDEKTYNISVESAEKAVIKAREKGCRVKAIIPVHLYGQCADMDGVMDLARRYNLKIIEDAAQALGSVYPTGGRFVCAGTIGDCGCFSFFPSKNLGCLGDGGLVATNSDDLADRMRLLRTHGARPKYYHAEIGGNFRLDALQAAVLMKKLPQLDGWHRGRRVNAEKYRRLFNESGLVEKELVRLPGEIHPEVEKGHIYNQFVIRVTDRDGLRLHLNEKGIGNEIYYPVPFHLQKCFSGLGYKGGDFPFAEAAAAESLAIPVFPELTGSQQEYIVDTISCFYKK